MAKSYSIVGMNHAKAEDFVKSLPAGTPLVLVREPLNEFDRNAIAVWAQGRKIGFIPKAQNKVLAQFIDQSGRDWIGSKLEPEIAQDASPDFPRGKAIDASFFRSPNSHYPMVEVTA